MAEDEADGICRQAGDVGEEAGGLGSVLGRSGVDKQVADRLVRQVGQAAVAAQALQPLIAQDTEDPGAERTGGILARKGIQRTHEGILRAVVGQVCITRETACIGAQGREALFCKAGEQIVPGAGMRGGETPDGAFRDKARWGKERAARGVGRFGCPSGGNP